MRKKLFGDIFGKWTTDSDSAPQETLINICRLTICHWEVNRGQWPQVTLDDLETHVVQSQGSQLVMYWRQSHQLSPFKSIAARQVAFSYDFAEILSKVVPLMTSWPDLTWPIFFHQKLHKGHPISYGKLQRDTSNGLASSSEKLMGGFINPPSTGEGLTLAIRSQSSDVTVLLLCFFFCFSHIMAYLWRGWTWFVNWTDEAVQWPLCQKWYDGHEQTHPTSADCYPILCDSPHYKVCHIPMRFHLPLPLTLSTR